MFFDTLRCAVMAAPRSGLPELSSLLWKGFGEGQVTESEAEALTTLIEARRSVPASPPLRRRGPRPRSPDSVLRRRRWAASGWLPNGIAQNFTLAEVAVLAVVASEFAVKGRSALTHEHVAARAGVGRTTVKKALRQARALGLVTIEERRRPGGRNAANIVRVACPDWTGWLRRVRARPSGGGGGKAPATNTKDKGRAAGDRSEGRKGLPGEAVRVGALRSGAGPHARAA